MTGFDTANIMEEIRQGIQACLVRAVASIAGQDLMPSSIPLEAPKEEKFGEFATPLAMSLARSLRRPPRELAEGIVRAIMADEKRGYISRVEVAGPGFINFHLDNAWLARTVGIVNHRDREYGKTVHIPSRNVLVEFVSANPVGPLNVVNARAAAVGDTLVRLFRAIGYTASSEFYVNDAGNQVGILAESVYARYMELKGVEHPFPENGYRGGYVKDIAQAAMDCHADELDAMSSEEAIDFLRDYALEYVLAWQKRSLAAYGVEFDRWFSERVLRDSGAVERLIETMMEAGHTYSSEGALWFRSTQFRDDKDRVLIKSDGEYTYVTPDLAYHKNKLERGNDLLIDILGPDHHGYQGRMQAGISSFGYPEGTLEVLILQLVTLMRDGQPVKMSKRAGEFITLDELLEEVPRDAARCFFIMRNTSSHLDFDLDLAKAQTMDNPVWYVQYGHARACAIFRQAQAAGVDPLSYRHADFGLLSHPSEIALTKKIAALPDEVIAAAEERAPSRIARYALDLAGLFHSFYTECRVVGQEDQITSARLGLVNASRIALRNVLNLMGVDAPERM